MGDDFEGQDDISALCSMLSLNSRADVRGTAMELVLGLSVSNIPPGSLSGHQALDIYCWNAVSSSIYAFYQGIARIASTTLLTETF